MHAEDARGGRDAPICPCHRKQGVEQRIARGRRLLRLAAGLIVLAIPLGGCGTGSLWDKFMAKDDTFIEEPADKLYNEGLFLMNNRKDPKAASGLPGCRVT